MSLKDFIRPFLPDRAVTFVKERKQDLIRLRCYLTPQRSYRPGKYPPGVNLTGYIQAEMGLGQSCRCLAQALEAGNVPFSVISYQHGAPAKMGDCSWDSKMNGVRYDVNLTVINADQLYSAVPRLGADYWNGHYQIAHYAWELPEYPAEWVRVSRRFDEIWTPSTFCTQAVAAAVDRPVYTIPYVIEPKLSQPRSREHFGLPEDRFLFLCMFDVNSVIQRKNPMAAISAFLKAFPEDDPRVGLVVKVNDAQGNPEVQSYLKELIREHSNIYLINQVLSRNDVNALICVCDCFVSMHRSEGFGLVMAEAMYFGKPVIATNWSSNTDFMNEENSCPVRCQLVPVDQDYVVYKKGQIWADPDVDHCAGYMRALVEDPEYRRRIAAAGQASIRRQYSAESAAKAIKERLDQIAQIKK